MCAVVCRGVRQEPRAAQLSWRASYSRATGATARLLFCFGPRPPNKPAHAEAPAPPRSANSSSRAARCHRIRAVTAALDGCLALCTPIAPPRPRSNRSARLILWSLQRLCVHPSALLSLCGALCIALVPVGGRMAGVLALTIEAREERKSGIRALQDDFVVVRPVLRASGAPPAGAGAAPEALWWLALGGSIGIAATAATPSTAPPAAAPRLSRVLRSSAISGDEPSTSAERRALRLERAALVVARRAAACNVSRPLWCS